MINEEDHLRIQVMQSGLARPRPGSASTARFEGEQQLPFWKNKKAAFTRQSGNFYCG